MKRLWWSNGFPQTADLKTMIYTKDEFVEDTVVCYQQTCCTFIHSKVTEELCKIAQANFGSA